MTTTNPLNLPKQEDVKSFEVDGATIHTVTVNDENRIGLLETLLMTYVGKLCVFCGVALTLADLDNAVRANEPPEPVELAHEECYNKYSRKGERDD